MKHALWTSMFLAGLLSSAGCRTWARVAEYEWTLNVPSRINRGETLEFRADARKDGLPVEGISYRWSVDWVSVRGMTHKGKSFEPQSLRVKGATGTAFLRLYVYGPDSRLIQVAKAEFQVE